MKDSVSHLKKENESLQLRLAEAEDLLEAIRNGEVDAIVVNGAAGERIFSLNSEETPYRIILEEMNEGAITISSTGLILFSNRRFADMMNIPLEQLPGSCFARFFSEGEQPDIKLLLRKAEKERITRELIYKPKDKEPLWLRLSFSPLQLELTGDICVMAMDITNLKAKEKMIIDLNSNLEEKIIERTAQFEIVNKELESFSYSVSHDLRAPLRAVNSYAQIMIEEYGKNLNEDATNILESIRYNGEKMGRLIDELLAFSKLGRKEPQLETVNLDHLIKRVLTDMQAHQSIHAAINISTLPVVQADSTMLYLVLYNLLSNAVKYSSKKEHPVIEVFTEEKNNKAVFVVKDNGAGFDMQYADKLFGVFQRLHSEKQFEGNGVGLAIVQRIITKFGGTVWAEAKEHEGATFYFTLN